MHDTTLALRREPILEKRSYERPHLRVIQLASHELMAVGCKLDSGAGGPLLPTCTASACLNPGS